MVRRIYLLVTLSMAFAAGTPTAVAEDTAVSHESARRLFEEGLALAKADRWAEALAVFQRSAALVSRASTSYNIANALYRLDRPVEGLSELDDYDRMPEVLGDDAARERGAALRKLLEGAVAEVRLSITPADALLFVDGRPSADIGFDRTFRLNPGPHWIRVTHEGYEPHYQEIRVERGTQHALTVALQPLSVPESPPSLTLAPSAIAAAPGGIRLSESKAADDDRKPFVKRPGFWVMIGAIAAVGIGTGVAVALVRRDDSPQCGTTGECATTQGLTARSF